MPLTPPPDFTKVYLSAALGVSLALVVWLLTRSTLPVVGDRDHNLPHGGWYRDGTKSVFYNSPGRLNSIEARKAPLLGQPWAIVVLLVLLIWASHKLGRPSCRACGGSHP
uniref:Movement protein TGB2 n=1 Tax=Potato virus M TaxID=12167 RepID=A0A8E7IYS6_9VIRU|nr:triple gene block protein 2 [Potato virus M]UZP17326.1 Triple gene block 2 Protein [Potato virus M]